MQHVAVAYGLIFIVVVGYLINLYRRMQAVKREQAMFESKDQER